MKQLYSKYIKLNKTIIINTINQSQNNSSDIIKIIDEIVDKIYNERYNNEGYIYCLYNDVYQYYG